MKQRILSLFLCAGLGCAATAAEPVTEAPPALTLTLAAPFKDNAVLQQQMPLPVWGTALPGAGIVVAFDGQEKLVHADAAGRWRVVLDPIKALRLKTVNEAPEGKTMTISSVKNDKVAVVELTNLVVGDVWLCAGQSNMAGRMKRAGHPKNFPTNSVNDAEYPALRMLTSSTESWRVCSPETAVHFSRVAFFFSRRLQRDALVPIGVMVAAVGGSNIESWLNQEPYTTGKNYSRLIEPWVGYGLRGAIWYQGESNEKDRRGYEPKLKSLITGWRAAWRQDAFPVHFVQLPGIRSSSLENPAGGDGRAEIRQAAVETLALENTGLAVTIDVGDAREHPPNKYDTGDRLARSVLHKVYGMTDVAICPLYRSHRVEGAKVRIVFDHAESGLMVARKEGFLPPRPTPGEKPQWLAIQDADGAWHWAEGEIDGSELLVSAKGVKAPVAVRYAYRQQPQGHLLYNRGGMPVGPFSTIGYGPEATPGE